MQFIESKNKLVSIVIPVFNQKESFLVESIESALAQTYDNLEIIVSDNHSNNGSYEIVLKYAEKNEKIKVFRPEKFLSMTNHFNFVYSKIQGAFICPLSSDDVLYPSHVKDLMEPFEKYSTLAFSCSSPLFFYKNLYEKWSPAKIKTGFYDGGDFTKLCLRYGGCSWGGILVKKVAYNSVGGIDKSLFFAFDVDLIFKMLIQHDAYFINKPTSGVRLWEREEQNTRAPSSISDLVIIFNRLESQSETLEDKKLIEQCRRKSIMRQALYIPVLLLSRKHNSEILNETALMILKLYSRKLSNFALQNRNNILGIIISLTYIFFMKIRSIFKKGW